MLVWLSFTFAPVCATDPPPAEGRQIYEALSKGLSFLTREGDAWMNEKNCNACHHMPLLAWSYREAKTRGISVDGGMAREILSWSKEHAKDTRSGPEAAALLRIAIGHEASPEMVKSLVDLQLPDGSWKPGQQFVSMQRRDAPEATENSAHLILLALAAQPADGTAAEAARARAAEFFGKKKDATNKSIETLVFSALYAHRCGQPEEMAGLREQILRQQHPDGGWGWVIGEPKSDPLATGEVLYFLRQVPDDVGLAAIIRAESWLVSQQREDGSWPIDFTRISKLDRSKPEKAASFKAATGIYTFWGSAWATIGLLQGLPEAKDVKTAEQ